jgi:hypothetical protein
MSAALKLFDPDPATDSAAGAPPDPAPWQADLLDLLAGLDHLRTGLAGLRVGADGEAVLTTLEGMVRATAAVADRADFPAATADAQSDAVALAGAFITAAHGQQRGGKGLMANVLGGWAGREPLPPADVRDAAAAGLDALHAYFALFTDRFQSSKAARGWVDAASAFLADLKADLRELPE